MFHLPFAALGFISILLQITVLRELLTVFAGNELDIGITIALWLAFIGAGSVLGTRIRSAAAFGVSFIAVALLIQPTLYMISLIPSALGLQVGETISLGATFASTAIVLAPLCIALGAQFPIAVNHMTARHAGASTARVYGLEAAGAFAGGVLFTFALSGRVGPYALALGLGVLCILIAVHLTRRLWMIPLLVVLSVSYAVLIQQHEGIWNGGRISKIVQSRYGEIRVTELGGQRNVYASGRLASSYPDTETEERMVHLPMLLHPAPRKVLALGGTPALVREFLKYPVERIEYLEMDPAILTVTLGLLSDEDRAALSDPRARLISGDVRRHLKGVSGPEYDMIVINLPKPVTAGINRFYTSEFFAEVKGTLRPGGIITLALPRSTDYIGPRLRLLDGAILGALQESFAYTALSTAGYGIVAASDSPIETGPAVLIKRFGSRGIATAHFAPHIISDAFDPAMAGLVRARLEGAGAVRNSDREPIAYLYALRLWTEAHGSVISGAVFEMRVYLICALMAAFVMLGGFAIRRKARTAYYAVFTTGYAGMVFTVASALAYQSAFGYVYERFGLLSAMFMLGIACGAYAARQYDRGMLGLLAIEAVWTAFLAAAGIWVGMGVGTEWGWYVAYIVAGCLSGLAFGASSRIVSEPRAAGRLYAADLMGAFIGAALGAIIIVPVMGTVRALYLASSLKIVSMTLVYISKNEKD